MTGGETRMSDELGAEPSGRKIKRVAAAKLKSTARRAKRAKKPGKSKPAKGNAAKVAPAAVKSPARFDCLHTRKIDNTGELARPGTCAQIDRHQCDAAVSRYRALLL